MQTYISRSDGEEKEGRWRTTQLVAKSKKIFGFVHNFLDRGKIPYRQRNKKLVCGKWEEEIPKAWEDGIKSTSIRLT